MSSVDFKEVSQGPKWYLVSIQTPDFIMEVCHHQLPTSDKSTNKEAYHILNDKPWLTLGYKPGKKLRRAGARTGNLKLRGVTTGRQGLTIRGVTERKGKRGSAWRRRERRRSDDPRCDKGGPRRSHDPWCDEGVSRSDRGAKKKLRVGSRSVREGTERNEGELKRGSHSK